MQFYLTQSIDPAGTLVVPVQTTRRLCPSLIVGDEEDTVSLCLGCLDGLWRTFTMAVRSVEPATLDAIHLKVNIW